MLTKSEYLMYLDAPMHLWAAAHWQKYPAPSAYDQHLMLQGIDVERDAHMYMLRFIMPGYENAQLHWQKTMQHGEYMIIADGLVKDIEADVWDLYEVKAVSSVSKQHVYDAAFQKLVIDALLPVRDVYILHLNKEYVREKFVNLEQLFVAENINEQVDKRWEEVRVGRELALRVSQQETPEGITTCLKPDTCPFPDLCHPDLPEYPVYNIPRLHHIKARQLKDAGMLDLRELPLDFPLTEKQQPYADVVRAGKSLIDRAGIEAELSRLQYPLYFLDYETYAPAVPLFDGYRPYQRIVFQYSLHVIQQPGAEMQHHEFISTDETDPARELAAHLAERLGPTGSVIVWNKAFEGSCNKEMGDRYPEYAAFFEGINDRLFDLMEIFSKGYYLHPDFHGSSSIKKVLPVLVPELSYEGMEVGKGDEAMLAWHEIISGSQTEEQREGRLQALYDYCELDTLAMVRIWEEVKTNLQQPNLR